MGVFVNVDGHEVDVESRVLRHTLDDGRERLARAAPATRQSMTEFQTEQGLDCALCVEVDDDTPVRFAAVVKDLSQRLPEGSANSKRGATGSVVDLGGRGVIRLQYGTGRRDPAGEMAAGCATNCGA